MRYFVIPDLHGHYLEYQLLLHQAWKWVRETRPALDYVITLGDYTDGGPNSDLILQSLMHNWAEATQTEWLCLRGNHDQMLINAWRNPQDTSTFLLWFMQGGRETLRSFGGPGEARAAQNVIREYIPAKYIDWLEYRPHYHETEAFIFVHAGLRPGIPLVDQKKHDLLWIRNEFIDSDYDFGKRVVFGHTTLKKPLVLPNKIGLDTKGRTDGVLTGAFLDDDHPEQVQFITSG